MGLGAGPKGASRMNTKFKVGIFAAFAIAAAAIPLTITNAFAQEKAPQAQDQGGAPPPAGFQGGQGFGGGQGQGQGQGQPPQGGFRGQGGQGQGQGFPGGGMQMGGAGGGGTTMVEEGLYLYIVQGNRVYKLLKQDLKVIAQGELPRAMGGPQPGGGQGGPGNRGGGGGGEEKK